MARNQIIKILRTTRAALDTQATANGLLEGEPYFITDENKIAVGTAANNYIDINGSSMTGAQIVSALDVELGSNSWSEGRYDYVQASNPTITINPSALYATWLNSNTGELFVCTDNTINSNVWNGDNGTKILGIPTDSLLFEWGGISGSLLINKQLTPGNNLVTGMIDGGVLANDWFVTKWGDGFVNLGDLLKTPADFSVSFWAQINDVISGVPQIFSRYDTTSKRAFKIFYNNGGIGFLITSDVDNAAADIFYEPINTTSVVLGIPFHIVVTYDLDGLTKFYCNNIELVSDTSPIYTVVDTPTWLCTDADPGEHGGTLNGGVTKLRVYSRVITTNEISSLYNETI